MNNLQIKYFLTLPEYNNFADIISFYNSGLNSTKLASLKEGIG